MDDQEIQQLISDSIEKASQLFSSGNSVAAEDMFRQILRVDPGSVRAMEMGSLVLNKNNKNDEAKEWLVKAITLDPTNYRLFNNLGLIHGCMNEHSQAIRCFEKALCINPQSYIKTNLAIEQKKSGNYEKAKEVFEETILEYGDCPHVFFNFGAVIQEFGEIEKAIGLYEKALKLKYDFPVCHYNLSACWFLLGEYEKAWKEYEWRWKQFAHFERIRLRFREPYWSGENLEGKTILLYNEQGSGDMIMASRFISELEDMGGRVIVECPTAMESLIDVENYTDQPIDFHCSILSVPGILGKTPDNISGEPYLCVSTEEWDGSCKRIGICWAGSPLHPNDRNRSCPLRYFECLQRDGVELYSFQKDVRPHVYPGNGVVDYMKGANIKYINLAEKMVSFEATAELLSQMDLVVTVDTCIAHMAGAMGIETWLMLPTMPDWRWLMDGETTHWYKSVRLFRGEWKDIFKRIQATLSCLYFPLK